MASIQREQKLGHELVRRGVLDDVQLSSALASAEQWGQRLTQAILHLRLTRETVLVDALAEISHSPKVDFRKTTPDPAALAVLDAEFCQKHGVLPFALTENGKLLHVAMVDPTDLPLVDRMTSARRGGKIKPYVVGELLLLKATQRFLLGMKHVGLEDTAEEAPVAEIDEIKLVDSSGRTLMLTDAVASMKEIAKQQAAALAAATVTSVPALTRPQPNTPAPVAAPKPKPVATAPLPRPTPSPPTSAVQFSEGEARMSLRLDALEKQVTALRQSQQYSERILRALLDSLLGSGAVSAADLKARLNPAPKVGG